MASVVPIEVLFLKATELLLPDQPEPLMLTDHGHVFVWSHDW